MSKPEASREDYLLAMIAGQVAQRVGAQLGTRPIEETWLVLALAADLAERGVIDSDRHFDDMKAYAGAKERRVRLRAMMAASCDQTDADMARADGKRPEAPS